MTLIHHRHDGFVHASSPRACRAPASAGLFLAAGVVWVGGIVRMRGDRPRMPRGMLLK
ncbi:MAG: hypothetical protein ABIS17_09105 [Casimicrobiaceae bacterium]